MSAKNYYRLSRRTGLHVHCHRFRHTFAVQMLRAGTDLRTLQRLKGNSDIRIPARYLILASDGTIRAHQTSSNARWAPAGCPSTGGPTWPGSSKQLRVAA